MRVALNKIILSIITILIIINSAVPCMAKPKQAEAVVFDVFSEKLEYVPEEHYFVATGNARIVIKSQNSQLEAKKIIFDREKNLIIAEDDVKILKNGKLITGSYARFDLTKESGLIENPDTEIARIKINSETANIYTDDIEALKGSAVIDNQKLGYTMATGVFYPSELKAMYEDASKNIEERKYKTAYKIKAKTIVIDTKKKLTVVKIKNADVYLGDKKILKVPSLQLSTDKKMSFVETQLPVIGNNMELGFHAGPSRVLHIPFGATLKLSPLFAYGENEAGYGLKGRFMSSSNRTEFGYTSVKDNVIIRGEQWLNEDKTTKIQYAANDYIDNGIFGMNKPKYIAEIVDNRDLASAMNFRFKLRSSAAFLEDEYDFATGRFRLQGNLGNIRSLYTINDEMFRFGAMSQFDISVYGCGETSGVVRAGPTLSSTIGPYESLVAYFQAAQYGDSAFLFDRYVQGKNNLFFTHQFQLTRDVKIGHYMNLNLNKDNWNNELVTENQFILRYRYKDMVIRFAYDIERKRTILGAIFLIGNRPGESEIEFDKLKVNDVNNR